MRIGVRGSPRVRIPIRIVDEKVIAATSRNIIVSVGYSVPHSEMACHACDYILAVSSAARGSIPMRARASAKRLRIMEVVGALIQQYEDEHVPELA